MPFQKAYDFVSDGVGNFMAAFGELKRTKHELLKTREKLQKYETITDEITEIKKENDRLRNLLGLKERIRYQSIPATIISKDPDNWFRTIAIDRGKDDGVRIDMPVIAFRNDQKAVIGKIIEVRGSISRVMPIVSSNLKVGSQLQEGRFQGLMYGQSTNSNLCVMDYISRAANVKFGEVVITSGQDGIFPQGLLLGKVIKTTVPESGSYQKAMVRPYIDFDLVEEVFVIQKEPDKDFFEIIQEKENE